MRLIDADNVIEELLPITRCGNVTGNVVASCIVAIKNAPTIDAEPVRRGHWIDRHVTDFGVAEEFCGICEEWSVGWHKRYCPNCGAKMDE